MSHKTVQLVIGWLLTDEDLRKRLSGFYRDDRDAHNPSCVADAPSGHGL